MAVAAHGSIEGDLGDHVVGAILDLGVDRRDVERARHGNARHLTPALLATAAGLAIDNGIAVDAQLRTADPSIFAAGDCCSFPLAVYGGRRVRLEAWRSAQQLGTLAARNMLGHGDVHDAVPWFWSDQYDLGLQIAGLPDEGRQMVRRDLGAGAFILFHLAEDGRLVAASGIGIGTAVARDIRLAEMLIGRGARPEASLLAAADVKLKSLLAAAPQ